MTEERREKSLLEPVYGAEFVKLFMEETQKESMIALSNFTDIERCVIYGNPDMPSWSDCQFYLDIVQFAHSWTNFSTYDDFKEALFDFCDDNMITYRKGLLMEEIIQNNKEKSWEEMAVLLLAFLDVVDWKCSIIHGKNGKWNTFFYAEDQYSEWQEDFNRLQALYFKDGTAEQ